MGSSKPLSYCLFDGLQWNSSRGLGRYGRQLSRHLAAMQWHRQRYPRPAWNSGLGRVLLCEAVEPIWRELLRPDIALYPHNVLPFAFLSHRSLRVLVLHDVLFLDSNNRNAGNRYRSLKLRRSLAQADVLITVSETSRREILARLSPRCPVLVIPNALSHSFDSPTSVRASRKSGEFRVLHFGGGSPTKNTKQVLRAVTLLHRQGVNLHLELAAMSGSRDLVERWRQEAELPEGSITVLPTLTDAELQTVYARVDAHCMPSTGEGFGIPVIEAAMMKIPNVLSLIDVFHELIGEDAIFAGSLGAEDIAKALLKCLCSDTTDMVQRAAARASRYQFDSIHLSYAKPVFGLLEAMLHSNPKKGSPSYAE